MKNTLILLITTIGFSAVAATIDFSKTKNTVEFLAVGNPSALKIRGNLKDSAGVTGKFELQKQTLLGKAEVDLTSLDTGISLRNEHMKEKYLQVKQFPKATLELVPLVLPAGTQEWNGDFTGTLELHGVKKPVKGTLSYKEKGDTLVATKFTVELADFGIDIPKYMGITVSKTVTIEVAVKP